MTDCPYTFKIERNVSLEKTDLPEYTRQHGNHLKEDIEKVFKEELIIRLKQSGKI